MGWAYLTQEEAQQTIEPNTLTKTMEETSMNSVSRSANMKEWVLNDIITPQPSHIRPGGYSAVAHICSDQTQLEDTEERAEEETNLVTTGRLWVIEEVDRVDQGGGSRRLSVLPGRGLVRK
jgi:hypothetical protein